MATGRKIEGYTESCRTTFRNQQNGLPTVLLKLDSLGIPEDTVDSNTVSFVNNPDAEIRIDFKPNLPAYSIVQAIKLATGEKQLRILTHSEIEDIYTVNDVIETTPALPDPNTKLVMNNTAQIGYSDDVDIHYKPYKVLTRVLTSAEKTALYNEFISEFG